MKINQSRHEIFCFSYFVFFPNFSLSPSFSLIVCYCFLHYLIPFLFPFFLFFLCFTLFPLPNHSHSRLTCTKQLSKPSLNEGFCYELTATFSVLIVQNIYPESHGRKARILCLWKHSLWTFQPEEVFCWLSLMKNMLALFIFVLIHCSSTT